VTLLENTKCAELRMPRRVAASAKAGSVFMVCIWRSLGQGCVIPAACTATVKATRTHALRMIESIGLFIGS
jgi:hypothetical protein